MKGCVVSIPLTLSPTQFYDEFVDAFAYASASSGGKGIKSLRYEGMRVKVRIGEN